MFGLFPRTSADPQLVIGRVGARTARFWEDETGVWAEATGPSAQWFDDLVSSVARGDIAEASAAFFVREQHTEYSQTGSQIRVIDGAKLREGSVVTWGAYRDTSASVRSATAPAEPLDLQAARARLAALRDPMAELEIARARLERLRDPNRLTG